MKIYCLVVNKVHDTPGFISSNYRADRSEKKIEYYARREDAEKRMDEIYNGTKKLTGFIDNLEVIITECEVKE